MRKLLLVLVLAVACGDTTTQVIEGAPCVATALDGCVEIECPGSDPVQVCDGADGATGEQGPPGQPGQDGAQGPQGDPGPQGQPGQDGQDAGGVEWVVTATVDSGGWCDIARPYANPFVFLVQAFVCNHDVSCTEVFDLPTETVPVHRILVDPDTTQSCIGVWELAP